jgi:hypothetical protein
MIRILPFLVLFACLPAMFVSAQEIGQSPVPELNYPRAKVTETSIGTLDIARRIRMFDAAPDGSNWLVVDKFGQWESITINGKRYPTEYHSIPVLTARVSPNGKYIIWMGLQRAFTDDGFNATLSTLFRNADSIAAYISDYNELFFSRDGENWAATFPYANAKQSEDRNAVVLNGQTIGKNGAAPKDFVFGPDGWSYRTSDEEKEYLVTASGTSVLRTHPKVSGSTGRTTDSIVWQYAPHQRLNDAELNAVDFEITGAVAKKHRTSYRPQDQKNALAFMAYQNVGQMPSRWITNVMLDTSGNNMAYFACDPALNNKYTDRDERAGIIVYNGKKYDGPYRSPERLFLSKSGSNIAYSVSGDTSCMMLNKKILGPVGQISQAMWSDDEKQFAYVTSNNKNKIQVVAGGKVSKAYEHVGKIAWTKDGKFVDYVAVSNGKVLKVRQAR